MEVQIKKLGKELQSKFKESRKRDIMKKIPEQKWKRKNNRDDQQNQKLVLKETNRHISSKNYHKKREETINFKKLNRI